MDRPFVLLVLDSSFCNLIAPGLRSAAATNLKLRSSRRKEALIDFGFQISDFGF